MKKYIFLILSFFFGLGCVNANQVRIIVPDFVQQVYTNVQNQQTILNSTPIESMENVSKWFKSQYEPTDIGSNKSSKVTYRYDFSNTNESNVEITIKRAGEMTLVTLDEAPCKFINNAIENSYSINCPNPKKIAYLNIFSNRGGHWAEVYEGLYFKEEDVSTAINNQTEFIQNSDTTGANTGYGGVFNESVADTTGTTALFGVLQNFITNLGSNDTCSSFSIPIPFLNSQNVVLPCMRSVYTQHFGLIYNLVQIILSAIIFYWCVVNVLKLFKETLDPFNYKLEVLDL